MPKGLPYSLDELYKWLKHPNFQYLDLDINAEHTHQVGRLAWNLTDDTLNIHHSDGVVQQVGEEMFVRVTNSNGAAFNNGDLIGLSGNGTQVVKYNASGAVPPMYVLGLATHDIAIGERGRITVWGRVRGLDTSAFDVGDIVYADPAVQGGLTKTKPTAPNLAIPIGVVVEKSATDGVIFVRPILEQQRYYGLFVKTQDAVPALADTPYPIENAHINMGFFIFQML